jgi:hypothetical protein
VLQLGVEELIIFRNKNLPTKHFINRKCFSLDGYLLEVLGWKNIIASGMH